MGEETSLVLKGLDVLCQSQMPLNMFVRYELCGFSSQQEDRGRDSYGVVGGMHFHFHLYKISSPLLMPNHYFHLHHFTNFDS